MVLIARTVAFPRSLLIALVISGCTPVKPADSPEPPPVVDVQSVFVGGEEGYPMYRIPALIEVPDGGLMAFAEGRQGIMDTGDIDVVMKRSDDGGETWSGLHVVIDAGADTAGNPTAFVEADTGRIWLAYCTNPADSPNERRVWTTHSDDGGATWADPADITSMVGESGWTWYATGPGRGIETSTGRIVVPADHADEAGVMASHVIYSDDGGVSWALGGSLAAGSDESQVAELQDGVLMMNARTSVAPRRVVARSEDGGRTWGATAVDETLPDPGCEGSLLPTPDGLVFSNRDSEDLRANLTVRLSQDGGVTWPVARVVEPGWAAYSSLARLPDGGLADLYEAGQEWPYEEIRLARFSIDWLSAQ